MCLHGMSRQRNTVGTCALLQELLSVCRKQALFCMSAGTSVHVDAWLKDVSSVQAGTASALAELLCGKHRCVATSASGNSVVSY